MNNNIKKLKYEFQKIKNIPLNKSLRIGPTGLGYTFETLIDKKEDNNYLPDFEGIEIKTKLGYTKSSTSLFCLTPKKDNDMAIKYILNKYGYPSKNNKDFKSFKGDVYFKHNNIIANRYIFKTKIDYISKKIFLVVLDKSLNVLDDTIYWSFEKLNNRLCTKLKYLALIKGYPYIVKGIKYYKYTNLNIYKLKGFETILELLKQDYIYITFNIGIFDKEYRYGEIHDRGTAFKLKNDCIDKLFDEIDFY